MQLEQSNWILQNQNVWNVLKKKKKVIPLSKQLDIAKSSTNYINFIRTVEIFKRNK